METIGSFSKSHGARFQKPSTYKGADGHSSDQRANKTLEGKLDRIRWYDYDIVRPYRRVGGISAHYVGQVEGDGLKLAGSRAAQYGHVIRIQFRIDAAGRCQCLGERILPPKRVRTRFPHRTVDEKHPGLRNIDHIARLNGHVDHAGVLCID